MPIELYIAYDCTHATTLNSGAWDYMAHKA